MDLSSLLGGGGAGAPPAGPDPSQGGGYAPPAGPDPSQGGGSPSDEGQALPEIQDVLNTIQDLLAATQDPEEQAALSKAESALTALVLALQKQQDAATGTTPAHKYIARQQAAGN
jgi:hypothetical protein